MKRLLMALSTLLFLTASTAATERVEFGKSGTDLEVTVLEYDGIRTVVRFEIGAFEKDETTIDGDSYYHVALPPEGVLSAKGEPALPRICRSIIIPDDARVKINVLASEYLDFPATPVVPSKGNLPRTVNPADVPYFFGPVYQSDQWYPSALAEVREPFILRDFRGTVIELNAFRYNPASGILRVYNSVTVEVVPDGPGEVNVLTRSGSFDKVVPDFERIYRRRFINYDQGTILYTPVDETGEMLVITYDSFNGAMQPFVEWKRQKGIPTTIVNVSEIGNTSSQIMNYIQNFYNSNDLAWILLVGDAAQVATPYASGGASDPSYSKVSGGDDYPDIFVGRFSAENLNHVQTQVQRTVEYESSPQSADWYHRGTGIASDEGPGHYNEYDYEHMALIRSDLLAYNYDHVDEIYDPGATASQVTSALNSGRGIVNYCGHGSSVSWGTTGFSNSNVNSLVNDNMLPFIISVACVNGQFTNGTCFAEAWLRATNGGEPTGAVAAYMSSINQSWSPPMYAQDEAVDLLTDELSVTFGGICFNGSCWMIDVNGYGGVEMFNTWHIFGDPSLQLFTDTPSYLSVNHAGSLPPSETQYEVNVPGIERALCALYLDGIIYGSAYTDYSGTATIEITEELPVGESLVLTVTALNRFPYTGTVLVTSLGEPLIVYGNFTVNDAGGNSNGTPDAGESLLLGLQLDNVGSEDALGVAAVISSADPYVVIGDNNENFGTIPGYGTGYVADAYSVDILPDTPDGHEIYLELAISCDPDYNWSDGFSMSVNAPVLEYAELIINDAAGNGNGNLDPGEIVEFIVVLTNGGSVAATSVGGVLSTDDGLISVSDPNGFFGDIEPAGNADNSGDVFVVTADESYPVGQFATFDLALEGDLDYAVNLQFEVLIGAANIPTLSQWGIAIMSLLMVALATGATVRRRKTLYRKEKARAV